MLPGAGLDTILPRPRRNDSVGSFFLQPPKIGVRWPATRVDIMMPSADAERTEMKEQKKSKSLEIVEKQRALVVEKIIEDMKRDGLHWSEPYIPSLSPHNPVSGTVYQGGNRFHLGFVGYMRGFTDNRWCTFNQIRDSGWPRSSRNGASSPSRRRTRTRVRKRSPATTCAAWAIGTSSTPARLRASPPHRYRSM